MIRKMIEISEKLNAKVEGDNGEIYFINGDDQLDNYQPDYTAWEDK